MNWVRTSVMRWVALRLGMRPAEFRCRWHFEGEDVVFCGYGWVRRWATQEDRFAEVARAVREASDRFEAEHGVRPRMDGPIRYAG